MNTSIENKSGAEPPHSKSQPPISKVKIVVGLFALWLTVAALLSFSRLTHEAFGVQGDLTLHYHITRSYAQSFAEGDWLPRWAGLLDGGRGDALFTFYPPLCYLVSALLMKLFGLDVLSSIKGVSFLVLFLAQVSAYLLAREFFNRRQSLIVSLGYVLLPAFPLICLHRVFLANAFALSFAPLAVKWAYRLLVGTEPGAVATGLTNEITPLKSPGRCRSRFCIIAFALCFSAIILSHAITTYLTGLAVGFLALAFIRQAGWRGILSLARAVFVALMLTAFFLLPQLVEADWVQLKLQLVQQDYRNYFLFAAPPNDSRYRQAWSGFNDATSYLIVIQSLTGLLLALSCWPKFRGDKSSPVVWFGSTLVAFGFLISLPVSDLLWRYLPGLKFIQFPWRFQPFVALGLGLLAVVAVECRPLLKKLPRMLLMAGLMWLIVIQLIFTAIFVHLDDDDVTREQVAALLVAADAKPVNLQEGTALQNEDDLKYAPYTSNQLYFRPTGSAFILYPPASKPGGLSLIESQGRVTTERLEIARREFLIESESPAKARIETHNHPNWQAQLDGQEIAIQSEPETGLMLVELPAGQHRLRVKYEARYQLARTANLLSITAWAILGLVIGFQLIRRK
ncbi:MAG: hypothetical protein SF097_19175 [Acidobacteriota bacterium]|nr:hypothetical protein [Acidobacteriota bacterium]